MFKINSNFAIAAIAIMMVLTSCKTMTKVADPCNGGKYKTDKNYYRGRFMGQSVREDVALEQAKFGAREELGSQIKTNVQMVNDRFLADYAKNVSEELKMKFIKMTRQIVEVVLMDSYPICEEPYFHRKDGYFKYYVVMEMSKEDYLNKLKQELSKDEELEINFEMEDYQKTFDKIFD